MQNNKIYIYEQFIKNGFWSPEMLGVLKDINHITNEEYIQILRKSRTIEKDSRVAEVSYEYEIWDRITPINGVPADEILKDISLRNSSSIFLVRNMNNGKVEFVESVDTIKGNEVLRRDLTAEEVAGFYVERLKEYKTAPQVNFEQLSMAQEIYTNIVNEEKTNTIMSLLTEINENLKILIEVNKG